MDSAQTIANRPEANIENQQSTISDTALAGATAIIDRLSAEFPEHVERDLWRLERAAVLMAREEHAAQPHYSEIFRVAHDILGQGAVFGYPLLSRMAGSLCLALRTLGPQDGAIAPIVHIHLAGMRALVDYRITGMRNRYALSIAAALELLVNSRNRK